MKSIKKYQNPAGSVQPAEAESTDGTTPQAIDPIKAGQILDLAEISTRNPRWWNPFSWGKNEIKELAGQKFYYQDPETGNIYKWNGGTGDFTEDNLREMAAAARAEEDLYNGDRGSGAGYEGWTPEAIAIRNARMASRARKINIQLKSQPTATAGGTTTSAAGTDGTATGGATDGGTATGGTASVTSGASAKKYRAAGHTFKQDKNAYKNLLGALFSKGRYDDLDQWVDNAQSNVITWDKMNQWLTTNHQGSIQNYLNALKEAKVFNDNDIAGFGFTPTTAEGTKDVNTGSTVQTQ